MSTEAILRPSLLLGTPQPNWEDSILQNQIGWWVTPDGGTGKVRNLVKPTTSALLQSGAGWTYGKYTPMMSFDGGANAYVDLGATALLASTDPFTLMWTERATNTGAYRGLFVFSPSGTAQKFIVLRDDTDVNYRYLTASICNVGACVRFATVPTLAAGVAVDRTYFLIGRGGMGSTTLSQFDVWGQETIVTPYPASAGNPLGSFTGGQNYIGWDSVDNKWNGAIGNVRLWTRVLFLNEIKRLFVDGMAGVMRPRALFPSSAAPATRRDRMFAAM